MRHFFARHHNLFAGVALSFLGSILALHLSAAADKRQTELINFERQWKVEEREWFDSTMVQASRNDSLLYDVIKKVSAIQSILSHPQQAEPQR